MQTVSFASTYIDILRPESISRTTYNVILVAVGSLFIAAYAQLAIPLPFTPVPITGQSFAVLLIGIFFGSRLGAATVLAYLTEGASGLPFFAEGTGGIGVFAGPTGGYLLGFVFASYCAGLLAEKKWDRKVWTAGLAMFLSSFVIFAFGVTWLSSFIGFGKAVELGFLPFLPGDVIKTVIAALLLPQGWKYFGKRSQAHSD
jgi:biotin transport system substrate-specific component